MSESDILHESPTTRRAAKEPDMADRVSKITGIANPVMLSNDDTAVNDSGRTPISRDLRKILFQCGALSDEERARLVNHLLGTHPIAPADRRDELISVLAAAKLFGRVSNVVHRLLDEGRLSPAKNTADGDLLLRQGDVLDYLEENRDHEGKLPSLQTS
jgi:hypothetical protein